MFLSLFIEVTPGCHMRSLELKLSFQSIVNIYLENTDDICKLSYQNYVSTELAPTCVSTLLFVNENKTKVIRADLLDLIWI